MILSFELKNHGCSAVIKILDIVVRNKKHRQEGEQWETAAGYF